MVSIVSGVAWRHRQSDGVIINPSSFIIMRDNGVWRMAYARIDIVRAAQNIKW